jgi:hypothetical protein
MTALLLQPPKNSSVRIGFDARERPTLSWRTTRNDWWRFFPAAFLGFWLCGWAFGEVAALSVVLGLVPAKDGNGPPVLFMLFWLCGWTVGGVLAMRAFYQLVRPRRPEQLTFREEALVHDPGTPVYEWTNRRWDPAFWSWPKPRTIDRAQIEAVALERVGERQRLTLDVGADRVEIGQSLREPEREWLAEVLRTWSGH